MKNKYKSKLFGIVMLISMLIICIGIASAITMQGGNVVGQISDLSSGPSSAGTTAIAMVEHGTGSTNSNANVNVDDAAGLAASDASADASAQTGGVAISATVAWGNLKNAVGGFSYDVNIGSANPGATVETVSYAGVDLSTNGQSTVEYGVVTPQVFEDETDTTEVVTSESDMSETATDDVGATDVVDEGAAGNAESDTSEMVTDVDVTDGEADNAKDVTTDEVGNAEVVTDEVGNPETGTNGADTEIATMYADIGNVGLTTEELSLTTDIDYGTEIQ
jgi:hypothetical protein